MASVFQNLTQQFKRLPGIGPKLAERLTFHMLNVSEEEIQVFIHALVDFKKRIKTCPICGLISEYSPCRICSSKTRDRSVLCIVKSIQDAFFLERSSAYKGIYHVLTAINHIGSEIVEDELPLEPLLKRLDGVKEVVFAMEPSLESDIAIKEITQRLGHLPLRFTRIATGIPKGLSLEYVDEETLKKALSHRTTVG